MASVKLTINPHILRLTCSFTGDEVDHQDWSAPIGLSPAGYPIMIEYDLDTVGGLAPSTAAGLWRHRNLLPVWNVPAGYADDVGDSPTFRSDSLSARYGVDLWVKQEGSNPSGSFKDRGLAVGVALGHALGAQGFFLPTQGNAGVSASLFSTRLGLPACEVAMPDGYQDGPYHRAASYYGGRVTFAGGNIAAAGKAIRTRMADKVASGERVDLSTFYEPGRLEGKKTMGLEIAEHFGDHLPDWIVYPTGGGTGLVGVWKAFMELSAMGVLRSDGRLPKMVAVQSEACAPVVEAFDRGDRVVTGITSKGTVADGLDVPGAIMGHEILRVLKNSNGTAVAVSENAIVSAYGQFASAGIPAGYEAAATLAALDRLREAGTIGLGDRVLLLNTSNASIALAKAKRR